ncbi:hypothetical protein PTKIN_Ptkin02bG0219600 [Pterospermum kingtungense]
MADWSQLPQELVTLIAKHLETRFDVLRFRSVCSSWRSFFPPKVYPLPKCLPTNTTDRYKCFEEHITIDTLYLVRLPGPDHAAAACWVVNIREYAHHVKMGLVKPLSDDELKPLPLKFPKVLDLTNFQVIELGHRFAARYNVDLNDPIMKFVCNDQSTRQAAFLWSNTNPDDFMMLTVLNYVVLEVVFSRSGQIQSTQLEDVDGVQDIISFNGKFYVVELNGRTIVVDQSLNVSFLQLVGSPNSRMFLVQSGDNLLAVQMLFLARSVSIVSHKAVRFKIFRLDEEAHEWDEIKSLGDQILFLGSNHAVSASASEFYWGKGNLIFYSSDHSTTTRYSDSEHRPMFVFDFETRTTRPLEKCSAYCNLFWPPPEWLTSPESVISSIEVLSNSTYSVTSSTPEVEYDYPDSNSTISAREVGCKSPERVSSAGQELGSKRPSSSPKCSFKFCCF